MQVPQRVKVFMWITAHQRHLTNVERVRRHIASSDLCGICRSGSEDMNHILRFCVKASALWRSVLGQEAACSLDSLSFDDWLHGNISGQLAEGSMLVALPGRVAMLVAADQQRWEEGRLAAG
ncbi:hypothetical protein V6N12_038716 [Hibiscus sabdariffa]|uniref:Reverse transcriptase zinc-binding domain-containing protein n=1 Tax=Hibiscus sabdariffa TaxID=183260 RepID=A0ABR2CAL7_9ROSI